MKDDSAFLVLLIFLGMIICTSLIANGVGKVAGRNEIKVEAVKAGVAEWVPQTDGTTVFAWKAVAK